MFYEDRQHGYFDKGIRCGDYFWNMLSMFLYCHLNNFGSCGHKNVQLLSLFLSLYKRVHIYVIRSRGKSTQIMSVLKNFFISLDCTIVFWRLTQTIWMSWKQNEGVHLSNKQHYYICAYTRDCAFCGNSFHCSVISFSTLILSVMVAF